MFGLSNFETLLLLGAVFVAWYKWPSIKPYLQRIFGTPAAAQPVTASGAATPLGGVESEADNLRKLRACLKEKELTKDEVYDIYLAYKQVPMRPDPAVLALRSAIATEAAAAVVKPVAAFILCLLLAGSSLGAEQRPVTDQAPVPVENRVPGNPQLFPAECVEFCRSGSRAFSAFDRACDSACRCCDWFTRNRLLVLAAAGAGIGLAGYGIGKSQTQAK